MGQIHRFRDCAAISTGAGGSTVYVRPDEAEKAGRALLDVASSIRRERFSDAPSLTVEFEGAADAHGTTLERDEAGRMRQAAAADVLADLDPEFRARLVDEKGFEPEMTGGGCMALVSRASGGGYVMLTQFEGGDFPRPDSWHVGAYLSDDPEECVLNITHDAEGDPGDRNPLSIFAAVEAALSAVAEMEGH